MKRKYIAILVIILCALGSLLLYKSKQNIEEAPLHIDPALEAKLHLPPDPVEAGKQTVAGVDSDRDGVRDDVQRFIVVKYSSSPRTIAAGLQFAKALQSILLSPTVENEQAETEAINCFWGLYGKNSPTIENEIESQQLNTKERRAAMDNVNTALSGNLFNMGDLSDTGRLSQCKFAVFQLSN